MGSTLSTQEELFLCRRWPELLEEAMQRDVERENVNTESCYGVKNVVSNKEVANQLKQELKKEMTQSQCRAAEDAENEQTFALSFAEWQALLTTLEGNEVTHQLHTKSEIENNVAARLCDNLSSDTLHCLLISIAVYTHTWYEMYHLAEHQQFESSDKAGKNVDDNNTINISQSCHTSLNTKNDNALKMPLECFSERLYADAVLRTRLHRITTISDKVIPNEEEHEQEEEEVETETYAKCNHDTYTSLQLEEEQHKKVEHSEFQEEELSEQEQEEQQQLEEQEEEEEELKTRLEEEISQIKESNVCAHTEHAKSKVTMVVRQQLGKVAKITKPPLVSLKNWARKRKGKHVQEALYTKLSECAVVTENVMELLELTLVIHERYNLIKQMECWSTEETRRHLERENVSVLQNLSSGVACCSMLNTPTTDALERRHESLFNALVARDIQSCPVIHVTCHFILAIVAICYVKPIYAQKGIAALSAINKIMNLQGASMYNKKEQEEKLQHSKRKLANNNAKTLPVISTEWKTLVELEKSLLHKQLELDVYECNQENSLLINKNNNNSNSNNIVINVQRELQLIRRSRTCVNDNLFASLPPVDRWEYCQSQYIGQEHIWRTLRSHFLHAHVFDSEKPTVIILFGPSGFGKSELAKRIASAIHGCPVSLLEQCGKLVYIHMPSFCTKEGIYSLVDPPAAHVGDGILLSALHAHNDAVVVLDEFEKSTTEAVQHLWLSAFQKNGTLRSLKNVERTISTVKATFILTCNIAADVIAKHEQHYLGCGSVAKRETMRELFVTIAQEKCKKMLGEPFVNRIDYFFPLVPYTNVERRQFVMMTLERLLTVQEDKFRYVWITPRLVNALLLRVHSFHAATIEEIVKPLIVTMIEHSCRSAVFTVVECVRKYSAEEEEQREKFVVIPITCSYCEKNSSANANGGVVVVSGSGTNNNNISNMISGHWCNNISWTQLFGGLTCWEAWQRIRQEQTTPRGTVENVEELPKNSHICACKTYHPHLQIDIDNNIAQSNYKSSSVVSQAHSLYEKPMESTLTERNEVVLQTELCTEREIALQVELDKANETLIAKDKKIAYLTKLMLLEKALVLMLCITMYYSFVLLMFTGMKFTVITMTSVVVGMILLSKRTRQILAITIRSLYSLLGPVKFGLLILLITL